MRLFGRGDDRDEAAEQAAEAEREASLAALEAGGVPIAAQRRLTALADGRAGAFTSDLSVDEFLLAHTDGVEPVTQVMGSSIYKVGWQNTNFWSSWSGQPVTTELTVLSDAWNDARRLAFGRLEEEARLAGAHAVLGVRLERGEHDWASDAIEYVATGTAVRVPGAVQRDRPLVSDLTGQEFTKLWNAGYRPVGVVGGSTVYYVVPGWQTQRAQGSWFSGSQNQELVDFTQGVYEARETALAHVTREAQALGADGIVGVAIDQSTEEREIEQSGRNRTDLVVTFHVLATAIAAREEGGDLAPPRLLVPTASAKGGTGS